MLGPTPDATYTRGYAKLDPGDLLCMYTDGIVEAHDRRDREFGLERLRAVVRLNRAAPPRRSDRKSWRASRSGAPLPKTTRPSSS